MSKEKDPMEEVIQESKDFANKFFHEKGLDYIVEQIITNCYNEAYEQGHCTGVMIGNKIDDACGKSGLLDNLKEKSKEGRINYIDEKLQLDIYQSNIVSAVEKFVELDKGDRDSLLYEIDNEMEEISHFFQDLTREKLL